MSGESEVESDQNEAQHLLGADSAIVANWSIDETTAKLASTRRRKVEQLMRKWYKTAVLASLAVGAMTGLAAGLLALYGRSPSAPTSPLAAP